MRAIQNWRKWVVGLCVIGVLAWMVAALGVMPRMISNAYDGHRFGPLVQMMAHKEQHGLDHYQSKFFNLALIALAFWVMGLLLPVATTSKWFEEKIVGRATPGTIGAMRMFVCIIAISSALKDNTLSAVKLVADGASPKSMGVMDLAYRLGFDHVVADYEMLMTFKVVTIALLVIAGVGLFTRPMLILATLCYLLLGGVQRSFYWFNHTGLVPFFVLFVLCFVRCGDGFSLDRIIKIWRQKPVADPNESTREYGWARWFVWLAICIPYIMAGLSKLTNGTLMWWDSKNLMAIIYRNALRPDAGSHGWVLETSIPEWFFAFAGISTILAEIGMVLCLVSRRARSIFPPIAVAMHYGILKIMLIPFYDLMLIQALFWDWRTIRMWFSNLLARRRPRWILLYDGNCPLCRRSVGILSGIDLLKRMEFVSFRNVDFDRFNPSHNVSLTRERADSEMILVGHGKMWGGYDAYQQMTLMISLLIPIAPLMWLPGISHIGRAIYAWVAKNRLSFF
ncbi:MAG TPA: DUF393 domain-containing protein, partial [Tepidisphaeraceae bacterium]|nr:DUF393 domain-containing protein [Tepidisphaeraceae bacterium]